MWDFPLFPEQASTFATQIDAIFYVLVGLSVFFGLGVAGFIVFFAIRYREGKDVNRDKILTEDTKLEITWSFIPFVLAMGIFGWAAVVFFNLQTIPDDALEIYVIGKQWMWHAQHPSGKSEINELHVPVNQPVKLIMTSQDVIHNFYVPAFRVKRDVVPGRYSEMWFEATQTGEFHLFCAEYCGTEHAKMGGTVVVMEQVEYENWLGGGAGESLADLGEQLFNQRGCVSCHQANDGGRGPSLVGIFGETRQFADGSTGVVDEAYLRSSILNPQAQIVAGYDPIMPTYEGIIDEAGLLQLVAYIKSLSAETEN